MTDQSLHRPFAREAFSIVLAGRLYDIEHRPAAGWLDLLETTPIDSMAVAGLDTEARWDVQDRVLDGEVPLRELTQASYALLSHITGYRRWWIGYRLAVAAFSPATLGALTLEGVRAWDVSLVEWCAATYAILTRHASEEERGKTDFQLDVPLPGIDPGPAWEDMGMSAAEMEAMARAMPGGR